MLALWLKGFIINRIKRAVARKVRKAMFKKILGKTKGKLTYAGITTLVVGAVSQLLGIDIAPVEVDAIVTAAATIAAVYGRYRATRGVQS